MKTQKRTVLVGIFTALAILGLVGCGDGGGTTHVHQWGNWTVTTAATCTVAGVETRVCSLDATHKETRSIVAVGHDWQWIVTNPVTFDADGLETEICSSCGETNGTRPIPANNKGIDGITAYLNEQIGGNDPDDPILLTVSIDIGAMTEETSGWRQLLTIINEADKFVKLDLSDCTMNGTEFNPDNTVEIGKEKIVSITLPNTAESIVEGSIPAARRPFRYFDNLKYFSGTGLTSLKNAALAGCSNLIDVVLPEGLTSIAVNAFYGTSIAEITLPTSLTSLDRAFYNCPNLTSVSIPATTDITTNPFMNCPSLVSITITGTGTLSSIENGKMLVRNNTELVSYPSSSGNIILPEVITSIGNNVFYLHLSQNEPTSTLNITFPSSLTSIGDNAFSFTIITQLNLPSSLNSIGESAFSNLYGGFSEIILPSNLNSIGDRAFFRISPLTQVICNATIPPSLGTEVFHIADPNNNFISNPNLTIKVPSGSVIAYQTAENWSDYADRISAVGE